MNEKYVVSASDHSEYHLVTRVASTVVNLRGEGWNIYYIAGPKSRKWHYNKPEDGHSIEVQTHAATTQPHTSVSSLRYALCDPVTLTFDLGGRGLVMNSPCSKFGGCIFIRF